MSEVPMKMLWMGEDVETLPRERLIEVIRHLGRELETTRKAALSIIKINQLARRGAHSA